MKAMHNVRDPWPRIHAALVLALTMSALAWASAGSAWAQIIIDPSGQNSTIPMGIRVVGHNESGSPDLSGEFRVTVRDLANNVISGARVRVEFLPCAAVRLCPSQEPRITTVNCDLDGPWVEGLTGVDGVWRAVIVGCSSGAGAPASPGCARIHADGVLLGNVRVALPDLAGCDGVGANDLSVWLGDFVTGLDLQRCDLDFSGMIGANDLSLWLTLFGSGASALNCAAAPCP